MNQSRLSAFRWSSCAPLAILLATALTGGAGAQPRSEIAIPDIAGYHTLKCDFHMHTGFSAGELWPTMRVEEVWREGLDAMSITDHVEYHIHEDDVITRLERPYELGLPTAERYNVLFIRGAEITRSMPPGHFNALFLQDIEPLTVDDAVESIGNAAQQDAFLIWNHPGDTWHSLHTDLFEKGWMHGIEVVNGDTYYPEAHAWALEKGLTMLCNSDVHGRVDYAWDRSAGEHRPLTLVFAKERSIEGVREALFDGRTVAYFENQLIGKSEYLQPIFGASVSIKEPFVSMDGRGRARIQLWNTSDLDIELVNLDEDAYDLPSPLTLPAHKTTLVTVGKLDPQGGENEFAIPIEVTNFLTAPGQGLQTTLTFQGFSTKGLRIMPRDDRHQLVLDGRADSVDLYYTLNGDEPTLASDPIDRPFEAQDGQTIRLGGFRHGRRIGSVMERAIHLHRAVGADLTLKTAYTEKYSGGGPRALVDGFIASDAWRDGAWQGYEEVDVAATIDLGQCREIDHVRLTCLQDLSVWIFPPRKIQITFSEDGERFDSAWEMDVPPAVEGSDRQIFEYGHSFERTRARYVRVKVENTGICPDWHRGAGGKAWIFIDEIAVD